MPAGESLPIMPEPAKRRLESVKRAGDNDQVTIVATLQRRPESIVGGAEGRLDEAGVYRVDLSVAVGVAVAEPLGISETAGDSV